MRSRMRMRRGCEMRGTVRTLGRLRAAIAGAGAAPVIAVAILGVAVITPAGHDAGRLAFPLPNAGHQP